MVLGINNLDHFIVLDVGSADRTRFMFLDTNDAGLIGQILDDQRFDVENDIGYVFHDPGDCRDFVLHPLNFETGYRTPFEARDQNAPETVADSHAEAALEGLDNEFAVSVAESTPIAGHPVRKFQSTPTYTHEMDSWVVGLPPAVRPNQPTNQTTPLHIYLPTGRRRKHVKQSGS
jgi:hypothetical protein